MRARKAAQRGTWARAALATAILATTVTALAPIAGADPVAVTFFSGSAVSSSTNDSVTLRASAFAEGGPAPTGVVVFSIGGVERGRAELVPTTATNSRAELPIEQAPGSGISLTAQYLGSATHAPASSTSTFTKTAPSTIYAKASGTLTFGATTQTLDPTEPFLDREASTAYSPTQATFSTRAAGAAQVVEVDLPGGGTTTVSVGHDFSLSGTVSPSGVLTATGWVLPSARRVLDGGIEWAGCGYPTSPITVTGQVTTTAITLQGTSAGPSPLGTGCGGRAALVDAALAGPIELDVTIPGTFSLPVPPNTPTTTELEVRGLDFDALDQITLVAKVTGPVGVRLPSAVSFTVDGSSVYGGIPNAAGIVQQQLDDPLSPGEHTITATYQAVPPLLPSSDTTTIVINGPPAGTPATGSIAFGPTAPAALDAGTFTGAAPDPDTGAIDAATFRWPLTTWVIPTPVGRGNVEGRLVQLAPAAGVVDEDNHVTFGPVTFAAQSRSVMTPIGGLTFRGDCIHRPITATLEGTATATGMHLEVTDAYLPPLGDGDCTGFGASVNAALGTTVDLSFEVAGDFRRTKVPTTVTVGSYLPSIAQANQTVLIAAVDPDDDTPVEGTITFTDGATTLGTVPVGPSGGATLTTALNEPGSRTITATYSGDTVHDPGTATTTVEVTPAPEGFDLEGTVQVGTVTLPIDGDSVLVPQQGTSPSGGATALGTTVSTTGARLWLAPTTISLTSPTYGKLTAEVRLTQNGALAPAALGPDGRFRGLVGAFAMQVRKVTLADGTTVVPNGCVSVVLVSLDGQVRPADAELASSGGGSRRYQGTTCTGVGRAVLNRLTDQTVSLAADVTY